MLVLAEVAPALRSVTLAGLVRGVAHPTIRATAAPISTKKLALGKDWDIGGNRIFILPPIVRVQKRPRLEQFFDSAENSFSPLEQAAALFDF